MITISKNNISEWLLLDVYSEMHIAKDKIRFFEKKYTCSFSEFEKRVFSEKEDIEQYDDYIEWKAYINVLKSAENKIMDIKNGRVKIS